MALRGASGQWGHSSAIPEPSATVLPHIVASAAAAVTLSTITSGDLDLPIEIQTAKSEEIGEE